MVERLLERLETGIESAVSQERFKEASALRDEISRMHMDDTSAVLKVRANLARANLARRTLTPDRCAWGYVRNTHVDRCQKCCIYLLREARP